MTSVLIGVVEALIHMVPTNKPEDPRFLNLVRSARYFGNEIKVPKFTKEKWHNTEKLGLTRDFCSKLDPREIVLMTDAFDVLMLDSHQAIEETFLRMNSEVVISAEKIIYPYDLKIGDYPDRQSKEYFPYLNSGGIIGYAGTLANLINQFPWTTKYGDQYHWHRLYVKNPGIIKIDHQAELFLSMTRVPEDEMDGLRCNQVTGTPKIMHFNGEGKPQYTKYVEKIDKLHQCHFLEK